MEQFQQSTIFICHKQNQQLQNKQNKKLSYVTIGLIEIQ
ncbi:unnamed protein product [Paramecium pentaurelia]|uniref:Uncharacterized protein n=1 Tax=Paramecium pentaurelia TaxID=43138 RepID=A0A8S1XCA5_9CILI|nr:unnamed protein product [Paramecium pentaurelia]